MSNQVLGRAYTREEKAAILNRILEVWDTFPDMRLGQLIDNAVFMVAKCGSVFNVEDEQLATSVEEYESQHPRKHDGKVEKVVSNLLETVERYGRGTLTLSDVESVLNTVLGKEGGGTHE